MPYRFERSKRYAKRRRFDRMRWDPVGPSATTVVPKISWESVFCSSFVGSRSTRAPVPVPDRSGPHTSLVIYFDTHHPALHFFSFTTRVFRHHLHFPLVRHHSSVYPSSPTSLLVADSSISWIVLSALLTAYGLAFSYHDMFGLIRIRSSAV